MASSLGAGKVITDGLVLFLDAGNNRSYPGTGTTWTDLSSTAITGSLTNGPTFSSANGGSIVFDGTNDRVDVENSNVLNPLGNFTIGCWVNPTNIPNVYLGIIDKYNGTFNYGYILDMPNGGGGMISSSFRFVNCVQSGYKEVIAGVQFTTGSWNHLYGVYDGTNINIYVNGTLQGTASCSGTNVTESTSLKIGGDGVSTNYMTGRIASVQLYNRALTADEILQNYESTRERFNLRGIAIDPDASRFLRTAGITDTTQQSAIDTLVLELKNAGLWSKMKAIYPFVGGTASTHKWNLKDPRDVDAAFRLTFFGGWTHSSTGADPNGTTGYADTALNPSLTLSAHNIHLAYYSREDTAINGTAIGADNNVFPGEYCKMRISSTSRTGELVIGATNIGLSNYNVPDSRGLFVGCATNSTTRAVFRNGQKQTFTSQTTLGVNGLVNYTLPLCRNGGALQYSYENKECAFASIGDGLTDADAANLYTIVQKYQTTLGRQV